ncbi:MAG: alpha/beta fold hydrolase [Bacteroidales bacterium]|nr:alpha/beta fold hydrolase [Bacteroidales bacterium]MDD4670786.1 alpha/beta fold hydrolase [Bacteroidales bacterium]
MIFPDICKSKVILVIIGILVAVNSYAIIPNRKYIRLPQESGLIYKQLSVTTKDGYHIETWFYPAQDFPAKNAGRQEMYPYKIIDKSKRPTIIICNGDAGNMSYQQIYLAMSYAANGFNVVTFDWRGFGNSSEFAMNTDFLCYNEMLWDYEAVIRAVKKQPEVDSKNIFLFGWSTGGYLSVITAYNNKSVKGLFVTGIPTSFEDAIPLLKKLPKNIERNLIVPQDFPRDKMPIYIAPKFHKPIMVIVGSDDNRTPQWMAEKIISSVPDPTYKCLSVFEGAGHGGEQSPYFVDMERFISETIDFLNNSIAPVNKKH